MERKFINVGGDFNYVGNGNTGNINIGSNNCTQNFSGPVYNINSSNVNIDNSTTYNINWNAVSEELIKLNSCCGMLSADVQQIVEQMNINAQQRNGSGFVDACKRFGVGAVDFLKNIGLSVIPQLILHAFGL